MKPTTPKWPSEAAMCEAFAAAARAAGWTVYPETSGADLLLVAPDGVGEPFVSGDQVAVQAKLRANIKLLEQVLPPFDADWDQIPSADFYVALIPMTDAYRSFEPVCRRLGVGVAAENPVKPPETGPFARTPRTAPRKPFATVLNNRAYKGQFWAHWPRHPRTGPQLWTPSVVVDTPAGVPSPSSVTPWKMAAVRFCLNAPKRFKSRHMTAHGLNAGTFRARGWIEKVDQEGRAFVYALTDAADRPDRAYPEIVAALRGAA